MSENFGDFQLGVYADAVKGVNSRYPFDARSIERKAGEALPDWVYRYVSAAAGDGRTQQANIDAYSHYGIIPRMMVSPPQRRSVDRPVRQAFQFTDLHVPYWSDWPVFAGFSG
jgi:lactate 2-monooxygenase